VHTSECEIVDGKCTRDFRLNRGKSRIDSRTVGGTDFADSQGFVAGLRPCFEEAGEHGLK